MVVSLYSCGRDEENFPRAQEFLPERWLRNDKGGFNAVINPNATIPFAMGARSCVGRKLAETQMSLTMAEVIFLCTAFPLIFVVNRNFFDFADFKTFQNKYSEQG